MLIFASILIILGVGASQYRNGLFTSFAMLFMTLLSGLIAFGFWEPIADAIEPGFQQGLRFLAGTEDFLVMIVLFGGSLWLMRLAYQFLAPEMIDQQGA